MNISTGTIVRTVLLVVAIVNNCLSLFGKSPLPIKDADVEAFVSLGFTVVTALVAWWKNNSFTEAALKGDAVMRQLKERKKV